MDTGQLEGRAGCLDVLSGAIGGAADHGDAFLIYGEPGIGKTACLRTAEVFARSEGHLVLETACSEAERDLPFAGLHRLLRPLLGSTHVLPAVQIRALLTALGMQEGESHDRFTVSVATLNLVCQVSERATLVIIVDDIHWLDDETRNVLDFVARRLDSHPIVMVATASSVHPPQGLPDAFRELRLDRLDGPAAHRLLEARFPDLDLPSRGQVVSQAIGNPLALVELAKTPCVIEDTCSNFPDLGSPLSAALERAFAGRLHDLPKGTKDLVLVAALASDANLQEVLAAASLLTGVRVTAEALEAPQSLGLLRFDERRVYFAHPLTRTAIAQKETVSRRQAVHRALGGVIKVSSHRRAWHCAMGAAAHDDAIATDLELTTSDSIRRGDIPAAVMALERAAQLSTTPVERGRRLLLAAGHAARLGRPDVVARLLSIAGAGELADFDRVRVELLREDFDGVVISDSNRVLQLCRLAKQAAAAGEMDLALELAYVAAQRSWATPLDAVARSRVTSLSGRLIRDSVDPRAVAVLALADPVGHGRAVLSMLADIDEDHVTGGEALSAYALAARAVGHYSLAANLFDRAELKLRAHGLLGPLARNLCVAAELRLELGEWDQAAAALAEFATLSEACMSADHRALALATTAKAAALRGHTAAALELVSEVEHSPAGRAGSRQLARAQIARGVAFISAGQHLDAYDALKRVFDADDPSHHIGEQFGAVAYFAEAAVRTGGHTHAHAVVKRLQPMADTSGSPLLITQLSYAGAVLASDDAAEERFLEGLSSGAASSPWPRARIQLAYGGWLRRQQRVTQSRAPLEASLTILQWIGATKWAEEAFDELAASGVPGQRREHEHAAGLLSAQELKIARLAAKGLSNKEIGRQLFLSPRTVSSHLYRIFPKLGVSTRVQMAAQLDPHDKAG